MSNFLEPGLIMRANAHMKLPDKYLQPLTEMYEKVRADEALTRLCLECRDYFAKRVNAVSYVTEGDMPQLASYDPEFRDLFHIVVLLSNYENMLTQCRNLGIPEEYALKNMEDMAINIEESEWISGHIGLHGIRFWWMGLHFTGQLLRIGRLQYCYLPDSGLLDVHIARGGRLTDCDASYKDAAELYEKIFPELPVVGFVCNSWLLDPALRELLPASSNILTFQNRYRIGQRGQNEDTSIYPYVYNLPSRPSDLSVLQENTSLQKSLKGYLISNRIICATRGFIRVTDVM